jgi:hypothetical protein
MSLEILVVPAGGSWRSNPDSIVITDHGGWLRNYASLREASMDHERRLVVVLSEDCLAVVQADVDGLLDTVVRFVSPRAELGRIWKQAIPSVLDDTAIVALGLVERLPPAGTDLLAFALSQAYGAEHLELFAARSLDAGAETQLVWMLLSPPTCPGEARPAVEAILRGRLRTWADRGSRVAADLAGDSSASARIAVRSIVARYPEEVRLGVLGAWQGGNGLGGTQSHVSVPTDPRAAILPASFRVPLEAALQPRLRELIGDHYVDYVSGVVPAELEELAQADGRILETIDRDAIRERFVPLGSAAVEEAILRINLAVQAELSTGISGQDLEQAFGERGFDEVEVFFSTQYVPLKERFASHPPSRARLIEWNEAYSRWLVASYPKLLGARGSSVSPFAADRLHYEISTALSEAALPVVLIVDGLGWTSFRRLVASAERAGASLVAARVALAPLPTVTSIAMTSLVSGTQPAAFERNDSKRTPWHDLRQQAFVDRYPGAIFGKAGNSGQIDEALRQPASVWVLHTVVVDRLLHDPDVTGGVLAGWLDDYFDETWRAIRDAVAAFVPEDRRPDVRVLVASDHGYTDLLREEPVRIPAGLQAINETAQITGRHRRCLQLEAHKGGLAPEVRSHVAADWFVLEGERFGLPADAIWLLPRQQRATSSRTLRTHGGSSFDETLVPVASFALLSKSAPAVALRLEGRLVAGSPSMATLTFTNVSPRALRGVSIRIPELHASVEIARVGPGENVSLQVTALPDRSGQIGVSASVTATGEPRQSVILYVYIEPTEGERLLGEDRLGSFFGEEGF